MSRLTTVQETWLQERFDGGFTGDLPSRNESGTNAPKRGRSRDRPRLLFGSEGSLKHRSEEAALCEWKEHDKIARDATAVSEILGL